MHLTEETYRKLVTGEEFPGSEALAAHLEAQCPACEAFLGERRPERLTTAARPPSGRMLGELQARAGRLSRSMRTENLAVMLTDIQGFTVRTSRQTRAENERLLRIHEQLLLPVFRAFTGVVRKSIGDAFLVTFESPTNAVLCGAAIQDRLFTFNQSAPEPDRIHVRVVVNVGEVRVEPSDLFGEPVTVAQKLEQIAEAGEVTFTEAVYLVMNKAEAPATDLGLTQLDGLPEPVRLYRLPRGPHRLMGQGTSDGGALPYGGIGLARAGNLPAPDLAAIQEKIVASQSRRALMARLLRMIRETGSLGVAAAVIVAVLLVGGVVWRVRLALHPGIDRLIDTGELARARRLHDAMPDGAEKAFYTARLAEAQRDYRTAIDGYVETGKESPELRRRGIDRLGEIARTADCNSKLHVADAIVDLGDPAGRGVLEELLEEKPVNAGGLGGLFGQRCDPHGRAERALEKLGH
jgi:adenylate cyclase